MTRIVIINHTNHKCYIEDVPDAFIEKCGGEQEYIDEYYHFDENDEYSWDYVIECCYINEDGKEFKI